MAEPAVPARPRSDWLTVPNLLSLARLGGTPVLCWLILAGHRIPAFIVLAAMAVSDNLDGRIARATKSVSELGIVLDPTSDRVLVMATLVTLMVRGTLPLWMGIPVLARDTLISIAFISLARTEFGKPAVKMVGKAATFGLLMALPALVFGGALRPPGLIVFAAGGLLYYVAAFAYAKDIAAWLRRRGSRPQGGASASPITREPSG